MKADVVVALVTGQTVSVYLNDDTCTIFELVLGPY
jgi:hypothetical protein